MNIKQILKIAFYLISVFQNSKAECIPFLGESKDCGIPEERGEDLFVRPKVYRLSILQLLIIFLILLIIYFSIRRLFQSDRKKEVEQNKEKICNCPIAETSPDITETEKLSWESTSICEVPESENSKGLITVSLIKGYNNLRIFQTKACLKDKEGLEWDLTYKTLVIFTERVVLKDRRPPAARNIFTVGWAAVFRNTSIELESQNNEGVASAEVGADAAGEWEEVSNEEGKGNYEGEEDVEQGGMNSDGERTDVETAVNKEESESDEEDQWEEIEDCEKCINGIIIPDDKRMLSEAEENELLAKELINGMVRKMLDSSTGGVPATMEEKVYMEDLLETKLALEEEWENLERTRNNNWQDRMRKADEYLRALRSQVQQLSDFSKEHGNLDSLNSHNGRPSRSAENVSRAKFELPYTGVHGMPPMIQPLIKSNHIHQGPRRMPSPPARAVGFPKYQDAEQSLHQKSSYQNKMRSAQPPRTVPGSKAIVNTWCPMQERASCKDMRQWSQEGSQGSSRGSANCYPTSVSVSIGGTRRRCLCENTPARETSLLCSVCRRKHLS